MADDPTPGELARNLEDLKRDVRESLKDGDNRLAKLASEKVSTDLWLAEQRADRERIARQEDSARETAARIERTAQERLTMLTGQIADVREAQEAHEKSHTDNTSWSRSKKLAVAVAFLGAAATIAAAWIAAALAAGGVH